jgi:hypothetical protein
LSGRDSFDRPCRKETTMKTILIAAIVVSGVAAAAETLEAMPHDLEERFALSALPRGLRDGASVYLLDPTRGYVLSRQGSNAQSCFVERTEWQREDYANDVYTALCYDGPGMKAQGRVWFDVAQLRAKGAAPAELKKEIEKRFADGTYRPPERPGVSYMSAPLMRSYAGLDPARKEKRTMVLPHVMFYAPNVVNADFASAGQRSGFPFILDQGPHGYFIQHLGEKETQEIVQQESALVKDLCAYRSFLCIDAQSIKHTH